MKNDNFNRKINTNSCKDENLLNHVVITSTQRSICTVRKQLTRHTERYVLFMRVIQLSFCKQHSSRNIYNSNTEFVSYPRKFSHLSTNNIQTVNQS